ncbi:MAG: hypothetical protein OXM61_12325 [Candidatus Poribacteria bacterium]|nr:hypothetical protein [Candidatus Poribacteria bacterium]
MVLFRQHKPYSLVGRVEQRETRHDRTATLRLSGVAALYPTYWSIYRNFASNSRESEIAPTNVVCSL